ncbi:OmpH/Skp family outer membrane protein [Aliiroseovarius halocynthiae]|uniref:OmpH family outer membrane protein n=1 Tax=Aliiroseovarius halocynthiae TaxID=985055 RepID=UPI00163DBF4E|nr:OmpH family outer membrane protein [Aliiroseovarius halocynthiae]
MFRASRSTSFSHPLFAVAFMLVSCAFLLPQGAVAQQSETQPVSQIVTIDRQSLFNLTSYGKRVLASVKAERERLINETRSAEIALEQEERALTDQRAKLDPQSFRVLADAFDSKVSELRREAEVREQGFVKTLESEQSAFFERIGPILGELVRELGAVVILDRRAILLSTSNIDITELAVQRINDRLGDGSEETAVPNPDPEGAPAPNQPAQSEPEPSDAN